MLFEMHKDFISVLNSKTLSEVLPNELKRNNILVIRDLEKLCEAEGEKTCSSAKLLNVWFLLHGQKISKKGSGRFYKVSFPSVYVEPDESVKKLIRDAAKNIGYLQDFAKLCGLTRGAVYNWLQGYRRVPLIAVLKAAQINKIDAWKFLDNRRIYSSTATSGEHFKYNNILPPAMLELLVWVKTEGSNDVSGGSVAIHQSIKKHDVIKTLSEKWANHLKIKPHVYQIGNKYVIKINSSPLRQIMVLKYNLPVGYKSQIISFQPEICAAASTEELKLMLANVIETEGTVAFDRRFGYPRAQIKFYSSSFQAIKDVQTIAKKLGYMESAITRDTKGGYSITIASSMPNVAKLAEDMLPYLFKRNFEKLLMALRNPKLDSLETPIVKYARGKISKENLKKVRTSTSDNPDIVKYGGFPCLN